MFLFQQSAKMISINGVAREYSNGNLVIEILDLIEGRKALSFLLIIFILILIF